MPQVVFFREKDGSVPMLDWLVSLPEVAQDRCMQRLAVLRARGHELRRPIADYLQHGIYELRAKRGTVNYRMLYFFGCAAKIVDGR